MLIIFSLKTLIPQPQKSQERKGKSMVMKPKAGLKEGNLPQKTPNADTSCPFSFKLESLETTV